MIGARYQQLEHSLAEQVHAFYAAQLERAPSQVTCRIFADKLVIFLEDGLTYPEQLLLRAGRVGLVQQIRADLNAILQPKLKRLIEQISGASLAEVLMTTQLETGLVGISAILSEPLASEPLTPELLPSVQVQSSNLADDSESDNCKY